MEILVAFLALNLLIVIHELGHFMVAKWANIKVHEFALFMGPKIFSIQRGETTYSLRSFPVGGYVKMEGEDMSSEDDRAFNKRPLWVRAAVIFAGPFMNIIIAIIILSSLFLSNGYQSNKVGVVIKGSPAYESGILKGDKILKYDNKTVFIPIDYLTFLIVSKGKPTDVEIERNGQRKTIRVTPQVYPENRYLLGFRPKSGFGPDSTIVEAISKDSNISATGLKPGDVIQKMNDQSISGMKDMVEFLQKNGPKKVAVTVLRDGKPEVVELTPKRGVNKESYETGLFFGSQWGNLGDVILHSLKYTFSILRSVGYSIYWIFTGSISPTELMGPVGIVNTMGDVVKESENIGISILNLLSIASFISIAIGASNLLPIPPLDGSRLILIAVEAIRRKPLPPEQEAFISMIGFVLLIMLSIFVFYNDIMRIIVGG